MLAVEMKFLTGRYHATPWGRHVNEADVAWPPDGWRFVRALIATWHRKLDHERYAESLLNALIERLASVAPVYALPPAVHSHTRHYMPTRDGKKEKPVLVYDGFARVAALDPLIIAWPGLTLEPKQRELLDALLNVMGYLGRAESWLEARCIEWTGTANCMPGSQAVDEATGEYREVVNCLLPCSVDDYRQRRVTTLKELEVKDIKVADRKKIAATLPEDLLSAVRIETADLQKAGWSHPPAARTVDYVRPADALKPRHAQAGEKEHHPATTARFIIESKPLPRIEDAVKIGELLRKAVLKCAENVFGKNDLPPLLSGHGLPDGNRHQHAFYLPEDADNDGRIDHLIIHVPAGLCPNSIRTLDRLQKLYGRGHDEWRVWLENVGQAAIFQRHSKMMVETTTWISATPYLHPWHVKKNFSVEDQLRRECRERELGELISAKPLSSIHINGRDRRPVHFHRFRNKRDLTQPDAHGGFWRLRFADAVQGPLALGFGCHFGLGAFRASA